MHATRLFVLQFVLGKFIFYWTSNNQSQGEHGEHCYNRPGMLKVATGHRRHETAKIGSPTHNLMVSLADSNRILKTSTNLTDCKPKVRF